jgi:hypothetical protein
MAATAQTRPAAPAVWLSPEQVCDLLPGMTVEILLARRKKRLDPPYFKPTGDRGRVILYRRADVEAWVEQYRVATRSEVA